MLHLLEPTHSDRFMALLGLHYPTWRESRAMLNELPLADWPGVSPTELDQPTG